ncbi:spore germination protein KB [Paenibacillus phyllosphaerae]|uniref:Spore germination protein KB n=1 Tax=Paenibacillus phyllosphaerae TaxID=274593 RepID=A0A7W5B2U9_9BACL|nr:endospore germination permease [Paenibacillus phyllosphaerae]MBB3112641.1 spore germination protein KB [Paenibacillus phyllosphaerae]
MNDGTLTARQLMILVIFFIIGTTILVVPSTLAAEAKQGAWLLQLGGTVAGTLVLWFYMLIFKRNTEQNLFEMNERLFGRLPGKAVSLLVAVLTIVFASQVLFYIGSFIRTQIMPDTPMEAIHVLFMFAVVAGVKFGLVTMARTAEIYFPWVLLLFIFFLFFIIPDIRVNQLMPLSEVEGMSFVRGTLAVVTYSYFPLFITFAAMHRSIPWQKSMQRAYLIGGFVSGSMLVVLVLVSTMVLGPMNTAVQVYPTYVVARKINVGDFLQRVEVIVAFLWFIVIYFKLTLYFHAIVTGVAQTFGIAKQAKSLGVPLGLLVFVLSLYIYPNYVYLKKWDTLTWTSESLILGVVYPSVLLAATIVRAKWGKKSGGQPIDSGEGAS